MEAHVKLLHDLVNQYARAVGMGPLSLDDEGRCSLLFDDKFSVTLAPQPETGALILFAELGPVSPDAELDLCRKMLEANYLWQHTGGWGTLALAPERHPNVPRTAVLTHQTPLASLDFGAFRNRLTDFVDTAEAWIDYLADGGSQQEALEGPPPNADLGGPLLRV